MEINQQLVDGPAGSSKTYADVPVGKTFGVPDQNGTRYAKTAANGQTNLSNGVAEVDSISPEQTVYQFGAVTAATTFANGSTLPATSVYFHDDAKHLVQSDGQALNLTALEAGELQLSTPPDAIVAVATALNLKFDP